MTCVVRLVGPPLIQVGDEIHQPAPSRVSALAYYLAYQRRWVDRGELCALLWPESDERAARRSLRQLVHVARGRPELTGLEIERERLRWPVATDLGDAGDPFEANGAGGVLLEGFRLASAPAFEQWLDEERASYVDRFRYRALALAEHAFEDGRPGEAMRPLESWLLTDPLDETALRLLLRACRATGHDTEALVRFDRFRRLLAAELGFEPAPATVELVKDLLPAGGKGAGAPGEARTASGPARLARPARKELVGREHELQRLEAWLGQPGTVAIVTGPGGSGKTTLVREAAEHLADVFAGNVSLVPLAAAATVDEAAAAMANALGLEDLDPRAPIERALESLRGRRSLFVLDNVEQISGIGEFVAKLRSRVEGLSVVLTSRRRLDVSGSETLVLDGLPWGPAANGRGEGGTAADLFLRRARAAGVEVDFEEDAQAIEAICRAVRGMPLAVELAATWLRVLSPAEVARRFVTELAHEEVPGGEREERHRSIARAFDASWALLNATDRAALRRLSVFPGGCSVEAAEAVADVGLARLAALRDASMVSIGRDGRVAQHPLFEAYVRSRAADGDAELDAVRERHARFYMDLLREQEDAGQRHSPREAVAALQREHPNLEAAWHWALEHGWWEPLAAGGAFYGLSYALAGREDRWREQLAAALVRIPRDHLSWAVLEAHHASVEVFVGRHRSAYERCLAAWEATHAHAEPWGGGWVSFHLGDAAHAVGRGQQARTAMRQAADLWARAGNDGLLSMALTRLYRFSVGLEEREAVHREEAAVRRRLGERVHHAEAAIPRGLDLALDYGRYGEALDLLGDAVATQREAAWNRFDLVLALTALARVRTEAGDLDRAEREAAEALEIVGQYGRVNYVDPRAVVACRARTRLLAGDLGGAAKLLEEVDRGHDGAAASAELHLLRSRVALGRDRLDSARRWADVARSLLRGAPTSREALRERIELKILDGEIARAGGNDEAGRRQVVAALARAHREGVRPLALKAAAVATPWLSAKLAEGVLGVVADSPLTSFEVRRRPEVRAAIGRSGRGPGGEEAEGGAVRSTVERTLELLVETSS